MNAQTITKADRIRKTVARGHRGSYKDGCPWEKDHLPHCIYFYYVTPIVEDGHPSWSVRVYFYDNGKNAKGEDQPILPAQLRQKVEYLVANARSDKPALHPCGWGFGDLQWRRVSYLVVALDDPDDRFIPGDAVKIERIDGLQVRDNHSFFSGGDTGDAPWVVDRKPINVLWMINYMKNLSGENIPERKAHPFKFYFQTLKSRQVLGYLEDRGTGVIKALADGGGDDGDSGTNMGPPVPPPSG